MTTVYEAAKDTAKKIRTALKEAFPQLPKTHFKVRADGYDSVRVEWIDFPSLEAVEQVTNKFKGGRYDMHEDYHSNEGYMHEGQRIVGAQYIFHRLDYSPERKVKVQEIMNYVFGDIDHTNQYRYFTEIASEFDVEGNYVGKHLKNYEHNKGIEENDTDNVVNRRLSTLETYFQALQSKLNVNIDRFDNIVATAVGRLPKEWGVTYVSTPTHFIVSIQGTAWLVVHPLYITNLQSGFDVYAHEIIADNIKTKGQQANIDTQLLDWYLMMLTEPFRKIHRLTARFNKAVTLKDKDLVERSDRLAYMMSKLPQQTLKAHNINLVKVGKVGTVTEVRYLVPTNDGYNRYLAVTPLTIRWADTSEILYATTEFNLSELLQQLGGVVRYADISALGLIKTSIQKAYDKRFTIKE